MHIPFAFWVSVSLLTQIFRDAGLSRQGGGFLSLSPEECEVGHGGSEGRGAGWGAQTLVKQEGMREE